MKTTTIRVAVDEDQDDCLTAAVEAYLAEHPEAEGWDLRPRWDGGEDGEREAILLDVPAEQHVAAMISDGWDEDLAAYATLRAAEYRTQGWREGGADYDLGAYPGDAEQWSEQLGHDLDHAERIQLERAIRRALDLVADDALACDHAHVTDGECDECGARCSGLAEQAGGWCGDSECPLHGAGT
jgi:hypothetical protein